MYGWIVWDHDFGYIGQMDLVFGVLGVSRVRGFVYRQAGGILSAISSLRLINRPFNGSVVARSVPTIVNGSFNLRKMFPSMSQETQSIQLWARRSAGDSLLAEVLG